MSLFTASKQLFFGCGFESFFSYLEVRIQKISLSGQLVRVAGPGGWEARP